jgi:hypothetical protein
LDVSNFEARAEIGRPMRILWIDELDLIETLITYLSKTNGIIAFLDSY